MKKELFWAPEFGVSIRNQRLQTLPSTKLWVNCELKRFVRRIQRISFFLLLFFAWTSNNASKETWTTVLDAWPSYVFFSLFKLLKLAALLLGLYPTSWQGPMSTSLFWKWLGLSLALGLHGLVCTRVRVLGLATMLLLSVIPYTWLEVRLARRGKCLAPLWPIRDTSDRLAKGKMNHGEWERHVPSGSRLRQPGNRYGPRRSTGNVDIFICHQQLQQQQQQQHLQTHRTSVSSCSAEPSTAPFRSPDLLTR